MTYEISLLQRWAVIQLILIALLLVFGPEWNAQIRVSCLVDSSGERARKCGKLGDGVTLSEGHSGPSSNSHHDNGNLMKDAFHQNLYLRCKALPSLTWIVREALRLRCLTIFMPLQRRQVR